MRFRSVWALRPLLMVLQDGCKMFPGEGVVRVDDFGLLLTGTLRNVSERYYRDSDGEKRSKMVAVVDTGRDWLVEVSIRRDDVPGVVRALEPLKGEIVSMEVSNGEFRRLWFEGLR